MDQKIFHSEYQYDLSLDKLKEPFYLMLLVLAYFRKNRYDLILGLCFSYSKPNVFVDNENLI
jgi:hypothetical protein